MVIKRRLIIWLIKAYIKRWGKIIFLSFIVGLGVFFLLRSLLISFVHQLTIESKEVVGVVGSYTVDTLPSSLLSDVSHGLTKVDENGNVKPDLATTWKILDNGKTYELMLNTKEHFTDGTPLTSKEIAMSFSNVKIDRPAPNKIIFHLKDPYAPFLVTLSRPVFRNGFVGIGDYTIKHIKFNGSFIQSMTLAPTKSGVTTLVYQFYPTDDALKIAYALGEVSTAKNLPSIDFQQTSFDKFPNTTIKKSVNYSELVTLFYNTQDKNLSDKKLRDALSYALPNDFPQGQRAYSPFPPTSWAYLLTNAHNQDRTHTKLLLEASFGKDAKLPNFTISTEQKYENLAKQIQKSWQAVGIKSKIDVVTSVPSSFQIFLGDFNVPKDPDQYSLWHSYQSNNITRFNNSQRIDKLLEDGRKTIDKTERMKIYADFQKYLIDEQPATFLYFPYSYTLIRM